MNEASKASITPPVPVKRFQGNRYSHRHAFRKSWTTEFRAWHGMKCRCFTKGSKGYENYGGRGITVCERWQRFKNFIDDMGLKPSRSHSLDRKNNDGNYSCGKCAQCQSNGWDSNCRWATKIEQDNNRRTNRLLSFNGETLTIANWSRRLGISQTTLHGRLGKSKWSIEKTLTTPVEDAISIPDGTTRNYAAERAQRL